VLAVVAEMGLSASVEHVHNLRDISEHGVLPTPVMMIDGKIKSKGRLLPKSEIKQLLRDAIKNCR